MDNFSTRLQNLDFVCYGFIEEGVVEALDQGETEDQAESDEDPFQDLNSPPFVFICIIQIHVHNVSFRYIRCYLYL